MPKSDNPATIGKLNPSGIAAHIWSTKDYSNRSCDAMMTAAIDEGKLTDPGTYVCCWCNADGIPFGRVFTVRRKADGALVVSGGFHAERVTRWPPKAP